MLAQGNCAPSLLNSSVSRRRKKSLNGLDNTSWSTAALSRECTRTPALLWPRNGLLSTPSKTLSTWREESFACCTPPVFRSLSKMKTYTLTLHKKHRTSSTSASLLPASGTLLWRTRQDCAKSDFYEWTLSKWGARKEKKEEEDGEEEKKGAKKKRHCLSRLACNQTSWRATNMRYGYIYQSVFALYLSFPWSY